MSAAKRISATIVREKPEDIVAPISKAVENARRYIGTKEGVTVRQIEMIERAILHVINSIESYGDKSRKAGEAYARMSTMRFIMENNDE